MKVMQRLIVFTVTCAVLAAASFASAQEKKGATVGMLKCNEASGWGLVFGSTKDLKCVFTASDKGVKPVHFTGTIKKYGVDIGFTKEAQMVWLVFAPGTLAPGALAGGYAGATATAAAGVGVGANVLIGGNARQITLQPISVEGSVGLNVAAGVGEIQLKYAPR